MLVGRLEEFPSLKTPSGREDNPLRRKKRRLILYSLYIFSVIVMYRLVMTAHWLYTLDLKNLCLNRVVYDTKAWKKIEADVSLENSESPIHVKFMDVSANLFSVWSDGVERPLLSLRVPTANITKNKKVLFNGDIYIENFNRKNVVESRSAVHFAIKIDAKMYPRLCFIRFPFCRSMSFMLVNPVSAPGKGVTFKHLHAEPKDGHLLVKIEVENKKFNIPKFVVIRSQGAVVHIGNGKVPKWVEIGPVDVEKSVFLEPLTIKLRISEEWGKDLKRNFVRSLRGEEFGVEVRSFQFNSDEKGNPGEWVDLGMMLGFNPKNEEDYDVVFRKKKPEKDSKKKPEAISLMMLRNLPGVDIRHFGVGINKNIIPFIEPKSLVTVFCDKFHGAVYFAEDHVGSIRISVGDENEYVMFSCDASGVDFPSLLDAFAREERREMRVVLRSQSCLGSVVNDMNLVFSPSQVYICFSSEKHYFITSKKNLNTFDAISIVSDSNRSLGISTLVAFPGVESVPANFFQLKIFGFRFSLQSLGIGADVQFHDADLRCCVGPKPLSEKLFGSLKMHTRIHEPLENILRFIQRHRDGPNEGLNPSLKRIVACIFRDGGEKKGPVVGKIRLKYNRDRPNEIGKHFFSMSMEHDRLSYDSGVVIRNKFRLPTDAKLLMVADAKTLGFGPIAPVSVSVEKAEVCYVWKKGMSWIEIVDSMNLSVSVSHFYDLVALGMCDVSLGCVEGDPVGGAIKAVLSRALRRKKSESVEKQVCDKRLFLRSELRRVGNDDLSPRYVYEGATKVSLPIEVFRSARVEFDIPRIMVMIAEASSKDPDAGGFARIEISPCTETDGGEYKSFGVIYRFSQLPSANVMMDMSLSIDGRRYESRAMEQGVYRRTMADIRREIFEKNSMGRRMSVEIDSTSNFKVASVEEGFVSDEGTWSIKVKNKRLKSFLFSKLPSLLLGSFYEIIPSGVKFEIDVDKDTVGIHLESGKKNPWKAADGRRKGSGAMRGALYRIVDMKFSRFLFSEDIPYEFQSVRRFLPGGEERTELRKPYYSPFLDTEEYDDWGLVSRFGFEGKMPNYGLAWIPKVKFSIPALFAMTSVFPGSKPYAYRMNAKGMYLEFPLPFDFILPCPELPAEARFTSRSDDKELCRLGFGPIVSQPNILFMSIQIPSTSYMLRIGETLRRYKEYRNGQIPTIQQDISVSIFINGSKVHELTNRMVVEARDISTLLHSLAFLEKRLLRVTNLVSSRMQKNLRKSKGKKKTLAVPGAANQ